MDARMSENQAGIVVPTTTLILLLLVFLGIYQMEPPSVVSTDAVPTVFSAERAMQHVDVIAQNPRGILAVLLLHLIYLSHLHDAIKR